jgi:uncharacterized protein (TIGR02594 family)
MKPRWLEIAEAEQGVHEIPGPASEKRIVEYHSVTTLKATDDSVPWCSSFCAWCMERAGIKSTRSARARSWCSWGIPSEAVPGAVVVLKQRTVGKDKATGSASGFHVGFFISKTPTHIRLLGGNQGDSVKYSDFPLEKYAVWEMRWPAPELPTAA